MFDLSCHRDNLLELAKKIDSPFFYYDLDALEDNLKRLNALPVKLWYAVKANPLSDVLKTVSDQNMSFDVASIGELDHVLKQVINPNNILNTGPAKSYQQICYFLEKSVRVFVLESIQQYEDLVKATNFCKVSVKVLLRVQIKWGVDCEKNVLGGNSITPFGLPPEQWKSYFSSNSLSHESVDIIGLHCFQWGNITNVEKLSSLWGTITKELVGLAEHIGIDLRVIDLGGGLGIPYNDQTEKLAVEDVRLTIENLKSKYPRIEFWLELGRYAVAECGVYVAKVIDKKNIYDKTLLVLDGGSQHLARPFITNQAFPVFNLSIENDSDNCSMDLHGPLCTSIDYLGRVDLPRKTNLGDNLVFSQTGAYGFTESMPFFLCHILPAETVCRQGKVRIVRKAKKAAEWLV